jgi:uncharacterized protein VirK/YbjX
MSEDAREVATADVGYLRPLPAWAHRKRTWSPDLLAGVVWRCLCNLGTHRRVLQLLKLPPLAEAARANPRFAYKYLTHDYLARGLATTQRASSFLHHYTRMHTALPDRALSEILGHLLKVYEIDADGNRFTISMGLSRDFDKEGEFSLNLHVDGEVIHLLCFTIVPGDIVGSEAPEVLLISRNQGMKGSYELIRRATKALHDVSPAALLFASLQGVALAFGIGHIAGVCAARQSSFTESSAAEFGQAYDDFFSAIGLPLTPTGFFLASVPVEAKSLATVKKGHKLRTRRKRAFKLQIQSATADFFRRQMPDFIK